MPKRHGLVVFLFTLTYMVLIYLHVYMEFSHSLLLKLVYHLTLAEGSNVNVTSSGFKLSTTYIQIDTIEVTRPDHLHLTIDRVSMHYNIWNMILFYLHADHLRFSLLVEKPYLSLPQPQEATSATNFNWPDLNREIYSYTSHWFQGICYITDGQIAIDSQKYEFDFWFKSAQENKFEGELNFNSPDSLGIQIDHDCQLRTLTLKKKENYPTNIFDFFPNYGQIDQMTARALWETGTMQVAWTQPDVPHVNADFLLTTIRIEWPGDTIALDQLPLQIRDNYLEIQPTEILTRRVDLRFSAAIPDIHRLKPLNIRLEKLIFKNILPVGQSISLDGDISLQTLFPVCRGDASLNWTSPHLSSGFDITWQYDMVRRAIELTLKKKDDVPFALQMNSRISLAPPPRFNILFNSKGHPGGLPWIPLFLKETEYSIDGSFSGEWPELEYQFKMQLNHPHLEALALSHLEIQFQGNRTRALVRGALSASLQFSGDIQWMDFKQPKVNLDFQLNHFRSPVSLENLNMPFFNGHIDLVLDKDLKWNGSIYVNNPDTLMCNISLNGRSSISLDTISFQMLSDSSTIFKTPYNWNLIFNRIGATSSCIVHVDSSVLHYTGSAEHHYATLHLNRIPFYKIRNIYSKLGFLKELNGDIMARFELSPDSNSLQIHGVIDVINASYRYLHHFDTHSDFQFRNGMALFRNIELVHNSNVIAQSDSFIMSTDTLMGEIRGRALDAWYIPLAYDWLNEKLKGNFSYTMTLGGTFKRPRIVWDIQGLNGDFWFMYFDQLIVKLVYHNFTLFFEKMVLEKSDGYRLDGSGFVYHVFDKTPEIPLNHPFFYQFQFNLKNNIALLLPRLLPDVFTRAEGKGSAWLSFNGTRDTIRFIRAGCRIENSIVYPTMILPEIKNVRGSITYDPQRNFFQIDSLQGQAGDSRIRISNLDTLEWPVKKTPPPPFYLQPDAIFSRLGYFFIETDWVKVNLPGIMKSYDQCEVRLLPLTGFPAFTVAGPFPNAHVIGRIEGKDMEFFYPPENQSPVEAGDTLLLDRLYYNLELVPFRNVRYRNNLMEVRIQDNSGLEMGGRFLDSSFHINGQVGLKEGTVEYLGKTFQLENASIEFSGNDILTTIYGKAAHVYFDPTYGQDVTLEIRPYFQDPISGQAVNRGRIEDIRWQLNTNFWNADKDNEVLTEQFGPQEDRYRQYATQLVLTSMNTYLAQEYIQYFESRIKHNLPFLDFLRINPGIINNIVANQNNFTQLSNWSLLSNSRITLGKYLTNRWYFSYSGTFLSRELGYNTYTFDMRHSFNLEYRLHRYMNLNYGYFYDTETRETDKRIQLNLHFPLQF